ncbi:MAG: hypothetical protein AAGA03_14510 [Planctomycetota bacterium]
MNSLAQQPSHEALYQLIGEMQQVMAEWSARLETEDTPAAVELGQSSNQHATTPPPESEQQVVAAVVADLQKQVQQFHEDRERWECQREEERKQIDDQSEMLRGAWQKLESQQRQLLSVNPNKPQPMVAAAAQVVAASPQPNPHSPSGQPTEPVLNSATASPQSSALAVSPPNESVPHAEPAPTQTVIIEQSPTHPTSRQPTSAQPSATRAAVAEPAAIQPAAIQLTGTQPAAVQPVGLPNAGSLSPAPPTQVVPQGAAPAPAPPAPVAAPQLSCQTVPQSSAGPQRITTGLPNPSPVQPIGSTAAPPQPIRESSAADRLRRELGTYANL